MTGHRSSIALAILTLLAGCSGIPAVATPTPTVANSIAVAATPTAPHVTQTATPSAQPSAQLLMAGALFVMPVDGDMIEFLADRGSLLAWVSGNRPSPYSDRIQRADSPGGPWRTIISADAHLRAREVRNGRLAIIEYREDGEGAYNETIVVHDLRSGAATRIDHYALSKATFRGGGGAPRRPVGLVTLGREMIAWTHLIERAGGVVEGELRVAPLADPGAAKVISASKEWITPVALDERALVYVVGGIERDELHVRDLTSGQDRRVTTFAAPTQVSGRSEPAVSGPWVGWLETKARTSQDRSVPDPSQAFQAVNIATGEERTLDGGGSSCTRLSANDLGFGWTCRSGPDGPTTLRFLDTSRWTFVDVVRLPSSRSPGILAVEGGFLWTHFDGVTRSVSLFTPSP